LRDFGSFGNSDGGEYAICGDSGGGEYGICGDSEGDNGNSGDGVDGSSDCEHGIVVSRTSGGVTFSGIESDIALSSKLTGIASIQSLTDLSLMDAVVVVVVVLSETILF